MTQAPFTVGIILLLSGFATTSFADEVRGTFQGYYECGGKTDLDMTFDPSTSTAVFAFYNPSRQNNAKPLGIFELDYTVTDRQIVATPRRWIEQPEGYAMVGFTGMVRGRMNQITGNIEYESCDDIRVDKRSDELASFEPASAVEFTSDPFAGVRGIYGDRVRFGNEWADFEVSITDTGAKLVFDALRDCESVVDPEDGEIYVFKARRDDCATGRFQVLEGGDEITFTYEVWQGQTLTLPRKAGEMGNDWISNAPQNARIKGIAIGDDLPGSATELDGYSHLRQIGPLGMFSSSSIGFMGSTSTNWFENAVYHHASNPRSVSSGTISLDDLGIFSVDDQIVALMRVYEPPEDEAPRYDAILSTLEETYGTPSDSSQRNSFEWHYDQGGNLLSEMDAKNCQNTTGNASDRSRSILVRSSRLEDLSLSQAYSGVQREVEAQTDSFNLAVGSGCAYSIVYLVYPTDSGLLDRMTAVSYAHDPIRSEIWNSKAERLSAEISRELELQKRSQDVAPDL